jgi:hypothetical protein
MLALFLLGYFIPAEAAKKKPPCGRAFSRGLTGDFDNDEDNEEVERPDDVSEFWRAPKDTGEYEGNVVRITAGGRAFDETYHTHKFDPEELEAHRIVGNEDGQMVYAVSGELVELSHSDHLIYAMDIHGNVYVAEPALYEIHHSSFMGNPVVVGRIFEEDALPINIDEESGHFGKNQRDGRADWVHEALGSVGVDVSNATVEHYHKHRRRVWNDIE